MSEKKRSAKDRKQLSWSDIQGWTGEQFEDDIEDLAPNPRLEHLFRLMCEHDRVPRLLFHYTRQEPAKNIIRTRSVWASDAYQVKDCQEVAYPCRLLRDDIKHRHSCFLERGEHLCADLCSALLEALVTPRDCYPAVFVFCLTQHRSSEKHWKQYASHEGYALGFRFQTPYTLGLSVPQGKNELFEADAVIRRVVYDPKLQRKMLADGVDTFIGLFSETMQRTGASATESLPAYLARDFVENFKDFISRIVVSIKDPSWHHEREWRVIVAPRPGFIENDYKRPVDWIKTRHLAGNLKQYVALVPEKGQPLPLCTMIAGRSCSSGAKKSVRDALGLAGYTF